MIHTKTPWHVFEGTVQSENNWTICDARTMLGNSNADARRIVACVNACANIPDEILEQVAKGRKQLIPNDI